MSGGVPEEAVEAVFEQRMCRPPCRNDQDLRALSRIANDLEAAAPSIRSDERSKVEAERDAAQAINRSGCLHSKHMPDCAYCHIHGDWLKERAGRELAEQALATERSKVVGEAQSLAAQLQKWARTKRYEVRTLSGAEALKAEWVAKGYDNAADLILASPLNQEAASEAPDNNLRDALLLLAAGSESAVLALEGNPHFDGEEEQLSDLIDRGLLATKRTGTETFTAVLTDAGRDFIRTAFQEAPDA